MYQNPQPVKRKTFTPAIIAALVALAVLAAVTLYFVLRDDSGSSDAKSSTSSASGSSGSTANGGSQEASDGSFTYEYPSGFEDATGQTSTSGAVVELYSPDSDPKFPTTIITTTEPAGGASLDEVVDNFTSMIEGQLNTTVEDVSAVSEVDGEEAVSMQTGEYEKSGVTLRSGAVLVIHDDTVYGFVVNAESSNLTDGGNSLVELTDSVAWS